VRFQIFQSAAMAFPAAIPAGPAAAVGEVRRRSVAFRRSAWRRVAALASVGVAVAAYLRCGPEPAFFGKKHDEGVYTLVMLRHGESTWNLENRFTGWVDVDVTPKGLEEASSAGKLMSKANLTFDMAFTSYQKRALKTLGVTLEEMDLLWIPVEKSWRLNERMYGDLQGLNKIETVERYGEEQVNEWRRSYGIAPPPIAPDSEYHPKLDPKYASLREHEVPVAESLAATMKRVLPYWRKSIAPELKRGKKILITAHGNSIRALVKYLDNVPEDKIAEYNIPTGVPLMYKLNRALKPVVLPDHAEGLSGTFIGDPEWVDSKLKKVRDQVKPSDSAPKSKKEEPVEAEKEKEVEEVKTSEVDGEKEKSAEPIAEKVKEEVKEKVDA